MNRSFSKVLTLFGMSALFLGLTSVANVNASAKSNNAAHIHNAKVTKASSKHMSKSSNWQNYRSNMFVANKGYKLFKGDWHKVGNTDSLFHKSFNVNGKLTTAHKGTYYKLYRGNNLVGYTNKKALVNDNATRYLKVPYVSQWRPISAPEGCAEASLTMLLRSRGTHVNLRYIYDHLPQAKSMKGGQVGNAYGTGGFSHIINASALTKYAHRFNKHVRNISGASVNDIKKYVQSGHPVQFYGYSSYQLPGDLNRNHSKVITAYRHGYFRVYDPLYYSKAGRPGTQGRNMLFDRGAVSWYSMKRFNYEYAHLTGSNRKSALTI